MNESSRTETGESRPAPGEDTAAKKAPAANYTGYGWEGEKYKKGRRTTDTAKLIRKELRVRFPQVKASVRTQYFAGGSSIDIRIMECGFNPVNPKFDPNDYQAPMYRNPRYTEEGRQLLKDTREIGDSYRFDDSDGMIDYFNTNFYFDVVFAWEREKEWKEELGAV